MQVRPRGRHVKPGSLVRLSVQVDRTLRDALRQLRQEQAERGEPVPSLGVDVQQRLLRDSELRRRYRSIK